MHHLSVQTKDLVIILLGRHNSASLPLQFLRCHFNGQNSVDATALAKENADVSLSLLQKNNVLVHPSTGPVRSMVLSAVLREHKTYPKTGNISSISDWQDKKKYMCCQVVIILKYFAKKYKTVMNKENKISSYSKYV